jgi:hypothetical protein
MRDLVTGPQDVACSREEHLWKLVGLDDCSGSAHGDMLLTFIAVAKSALLGPVLLVAVRFALGGMPVLSFFAPRRSGTMS